MGEDDCRVHHRAVNELGKGEEQTSATIGHLTYLKTGVPVFKLENKTGEKAL